MSFGTSVVAVRLYFVYTTLEDSLMQAAAILQFCVLIMMAYDLRSGEMAVNGSPV